MNAKVSLEAGDSGYVETSPKNVAGNEKSRDGTEDSNLKNEIEKLGGGEISEDSTEDSDANNELVESEKSNENVLDTDILNNSSKYDARTANEGLDAVDRTHKRENIDTVASRDSSGTVPMKNEDLVPQSGGENPGMKVNGTSDLEQVISL